MKRNPAPGAALLHPWSLAALALLLLNDQLLKRVWPGVISGKLSDFAGVLLLPVWLHALVEVGYQRVRGRAFSVAYANRALAVCCAVSLLAFALPEVWPLAARAYSYGVAVARWPLRASWELCGGRHLPKLVPVRATADVTDLLALPMGLLAYRVSARTVQAPRTAQVSAVSHST